MGARLEYEFRDDGDPRVDVHWPGLISESQAEEVGRMIINAFDLPAQTSIIVRVYSSTGKLLGEKIDIYF